MVLPNYIRYRYDLYRQKQADRALQKKGAPFGEEAEETGEAAEYQRQVELSEQWRALIQTDYYRRKAEALLVALPEESDATMYSRVSWDDAEDEPLYLTPLGLRTVKSALREEQRHRREVLGFWIASLTGVGGVIIGVLSVWPK
ncbi:TPA: hypothetical protein ACKP22_002488 [Pseudomonas putida]